LEGLCCVLVGANYGTVALWWVDGGGGGMAAGATATVSRALYTVIQNN